MSEKSCCLRPKVLPTWHRLRNEKQGQSTDYKSVSLKKTFGNGDKTAHFHIPVNGVYKSKRFGSTAAEPSILRPKCS